MEELSKQTNTDQQLGVKTAKVKKIKYMGKADVYNLEVNNTHNFLANGLVVHNCRYAIEDETKSNTMTFGYNKIF